MSVFMDELLQIYDLINKTDPLTALIFPLFLHTSIKNYQYFSLLNDCSDHES